MVKEHCLLSIYGISTLLLFMKSSIETKVFLKIKHTETKEYDFRRHTGQVKDIPFTYEAFFHQSSYTKLK